MKTTNQFKFQLIFLILVVFTFSNIQAQDDSFDDEFDVSISDGKTDYSWKTPAGRYLVSSSFFSLHGYVNGVYASKSDEWTSPDPTQLGAPGQLLVPNTNKSSFQYDFALIFGSEINERTRLALETHYVADPSNTGAAGPGGVTLAVTEATGSYDIIPEFLTISGGIFWSPFGIINADWLGAQNNFALIPRASGAYPVHYNERGIRFNGLFELGEGAAINYVFSFGNGLSSFDINGQSAFDTNNGKTITGRIGIFPGMGDKLDIGLSFMSGDLRDETTSGLTLIDPLRYRASASAFGADATYKSGDFKFRGYFIKSKEDLSSDVTVNIVPPGLERTGYMAEVIYLINVGDKYFKGVQPKLRYDKIEVDQLSAVGAAVGKSTYDSSTISAGLDLVMSDTFRFSFDYNKSTENGQTELDNDRFVGKIIAQF